MSTSKNIQEVIDTLANFHANAGANRDGFLSDASYSYAIKIGSSTYITSADKYWDGAAYTYLDKESDDMTVRGDLFMSEDFYHLGDADTYMRFVTDREIHVAGGKSLLDLDGTATVGKVYFNRNNANIDTIVKSAGLAATIAFFQGVSGSIAFGHSEPSSQLDVSGDIEVGSPDYFYMGDPSTDGTWRIGRSGNALSFQRRETGAFSIKYSIME